MARRCELGLGVNHASRGRREEEESADSWVCLGLSVNPNL
jgi:hypothetical protein